MMFFAGKGEPFLGVDGIWGSFGPSGAGSLPSFSTGGPSFSAQATPATVQSSFESPKSSLKVGV